jgi:predicted DNA-binding protein
MPGQHKHPPLRFRPSAEGWDRLAAYVERTGRALNAVLREAVDEYLDRHQHESSEGGRQRNGASHK